MKYQTLDSEKLENMILAYKRESDFKKKQVLYLNLVQSSLELVQKIVISFCPLPPTISKEDLAQTGAIGLLQAITTYEPQEKGSFKTYASKFIKGKILHYLRDKVNIVRPPRDTNKEINLVKEYIKKHSENNGLIPDVREIAKALKLSNNKVIDILNIDSIKNIISLDQKVYSSDGIETLADRLQSDNDKNYEENYENKKILEFALNKLPKIEKTVIYKFYIEGESKKNIAKLLKVSATQVSRLIKRALHKMYVIIEEDLNKGE